METSIPIQAVYCRDFFSEEIAAETELARTQGVKDIDLWYTRTFAATDWVCPNTTNIELNGRFAKGLTMQILSCTVAQENDDAYNITSYADQSGR